MVVVALSCFSFATQSVENSDQCLHALGIDVNSELFAILREFKGQQALGHGRAN
jgi:hypothetical protein